MTTPPEELPSPREDPGWPAPSVRGTLAALVPGLLGRVADDPTVPLIVTLRRVFLGFVVAPMVIGLVLLTVVEVPGTLDDAPWTWALLLLGAVSAITGSDAARRRRIVCAEPTRLARQVSAATFLAIATANTAALMGVVAAFLVDAFWPYLLGLVPTAVGMARTAPTRARVAELDHRLEVVGCTYSASQVLYALPGDPASPLDRDDHGPSTR